MGYLQDMKNGKDGERTVRELFEKHNVKVQKNESDDKKVLLEYDLSCIMPYGTVTLEVKTDLYEKKSNNVAVEYWNSKKNSPSGIGATTATLWIFVLADKSVWICRTSDLKDYCDKVKPLKDLLGGDDNAMLKIYPRKQIFDEIFYRLDQLTELSFQLIISKLAHT